MAEAEPHADRILVLAPWRQNAPAACAVLAKAGIRCALCADADDLRTQVQRGAGAVLLGPEALTPTTLSALKEVLAGQPPWSDLPLLAFVHDHGQQARMLTRLRACSPGGTITLLPQPVRIPVFISAVHAVLLARRRQYEVRDHLAALGRAEHHQRLLVAELSHRVKNTLATVQAMANHTLQTSISPEAFRDAFKGRLRALASAHSLLTRSNWEGASLRDLIRAELAPYRPADAGAIHLSGCDLSLKPKAALALALALHELTTNAVKYGALSRSAGHVAITWAIDDDSAVPWLRLEWLESGGPPVEKPSRRGFGSTIIERSAAYELNGTARFEFCPSGLRCRLAVPFTESVSAAPPSDVAKPQSDEAPQL